MRLLGFYLSILNKVTTCKYGCAFTNDSPLVSALQKFDKYQEKFENDYSFDISDIFLYNTEETSNYVSECDYIFWDRYGYRPQLEDWNGPSCDDISNPSQWFFTPDKINSLKKESANVYEIGRMNYSSDSELPLAETIRFENQYSPEIRCSEIIQDNIETMKLEKPSRYSVHFTPFIYLKILNQTLSLMGLDQLTSDEYDKLMSIDALKVVV